MEADHQQLIQNFHSNGAVCVRGLINDHWLEAIKEGIAAVLNDPGPCSEKLLGPTGSGIYFNDYCNWTKIPQFKDFIYNSGIAELVAKFMDSTESVFYHEHVLVKETNSSKVTPWHHDQTYYPIDGDKCCSVWIPVDPVPLERALQLVAGSHKWGKLFIPVKFETQIEYESTETKEKYESIPKDINEQNYKILKWDTQPGDCIIFNFKTLHWAPGNSAEDTPRRVLSTRWLGDDTILATRPWEISPPTTGGLRPGDRAKSDEFPVIWKKS